MSIQQIKARIRRDILQQRRHLSRTIQQNTSAHIVAHIQTLPAYQQAQTVACYFASNNEVDLAALWHPFPPNKTLYFPVMSPDKTLLFLPCTQDTALQTNHVGITEPIASNTHPITAQPIKVIFLPLVAFDVHGNRLGMGGGYYDRYLANHSNSLCIGVAYEFQKQDALPTASWDKPLDAVITEKAIYWFSNPNLL